MAGKFNQVEIMSRVKAGEALSREEELFYLTEVARLDPDHAERILAIYKQTDVG